MRALQRGLAVLVLLMGTLEVQARTLATRGLVTHRLVQYGQAVFYGGRYDPSTYMTAAHPSLPFGTWVRVTHQRSGKSVLVKINDRGPWGVRSRIIDLSRTAAHALGIEREGIARVRLEVLR